MLGTSYTTVQLLLWVLVAAVGGIAVGWFLRQWRLAGETEARLTAAKDEEEARSSSLAGELDQWKGKAEALSADVEAQKSDLELRSADLERANAQLAERDRTVRNLEAELKTSRKSALKSEGKVEDRESTIAALRAAAKGSVSAESIRRELDVANGTIGSLRKDAEGYQATIESLRIDLDLSKRDNAQLTDRVDASAAELAAATTSLAASRSTEEGLRSRLAEVDTSRVAEQERRLSELEGQLTTTTTERDGAEARLSALEAVHAECGKESIVAPSEEAPEPEASPEEDIQPDKETALTEVAKIAARTRGEGPAVEDDLKKIRGVGPKLEGLLKSMDITSFRQVANFTADDIQHVTAALEAFPGRIERDNWMGSAAEEHAKKYEEPV